MKLKDFIKNFADQFEDTEASEIRADTVFKDLDEWSSILALSIISMIDEEYDVVLKGDDIRTSNTVEDLFNVILSKV